MKRASFAALSDLLLSKKIKERRFIAIRRTTQQKTEGVRTNK